MILAVVLLCDQSAGAQAVPQRFEVVSVRPNAGPNRMDQRFLPAPEGIRLVGWPVVSLIQYAYNIQPFRMIDLPRWTYQETFDLEGKADGPISEQQRQLMLQTVLREEFQLKARLEKREQTVYVMTVARPDGKLGPALKARPECLSKPCETSFNGGFGMVRATASTLEGLPWILSTQLSQVVQDESGLSGPFDFELSWRPENANATDTRPSLFTAVEEQLGIKLTPQRRPVDVLVIETIGRPPTDRP
jgi:uncharacterized protein (TIGR03435 family)